MAGEDPRLAEGLLIREAQHPVFSMLGLRVNRGVLSVGGDELLEGTPQVVHGVEFRPLLGQQKQVNVQACGQSLGLGGGVATGLVQQQVQRAPRVARSQQSQEGLEVLLPHGGALQHDPVPGARVDGAEEHAPGILASDGDLGLLSPERPGCSQRWELAQQRLIQHEHHCSRGTLSQAANKGCFFWGRWGAFCEYT